MLSGGETGNKVWGVGGFTLTKTSNQVLNIDLSNGEVILKPEMIFNKNISGGCAVLIDDTYLYIIGGSGNLTIYIVMKSSFPPFFRLCQRMRR